MLRNDLITAMGHEGFDNDSVTVELGDIPIDVTGVMHGNGCIVLTLDPDDLAAQLKRLSDRPTAT
jgi:hypothetical protein